MQFRMQMILLMAVVMTTAIGCSTVGVLSEISTIGKVIEEREDEQLATSLPETPASKAVAAATIVGPAPQPTEAEALSQVMPDLQALLLEDSKKHAELLEKLSDTDPAMWADMTRRARAEVAYRDSKELQSSQVVLASHQNPMMQPNQPQAVTQVSHNQMPSAISETSTAIAPPTAQIPQTANVMENKFAASPYAANQVASQSDSSQSSAPQVIQNQFASQPAANEPIARNLPVVISPPAEPVRVASASARTETAAVIANSAYQTPVEKEQELTWQEKIDAAILAYEEHLADTPTSTREAYDHARLRLLKLAAMRDEEALEAIPGLSTGEQNYWSKQLFALTTMMDTETQVDRKRRASAASIHQAEALSQLRSMGTLQVRNLSFCSKIYGFGAYEAISEPKFTAGAEVSLYTEIENYHSDSTAQGYHTLIGTSYRVEDQSGHLVDEGEFPVVEDYCLTKRRDFHITYGVTLPTTVYPGKYQVRINLIDQLGDKIAEDVIPFEIITP